jgi:pyrroloquinoline-quinone synthase
MYESLSKQLLTIIAPYDLLTHPFYQAWNAGTLTQTQLQVYASQYYAQVNHFPRFISRVHTFCPELSVRKVLLENLVDEENKGTAHPDLYLQFTQGLGLSDATVKHCPLLPETNQLIETFYQLATNDWRMGLCALYAYEAQIPRLSTTKIQGLKQFYGISDANTLEFFTAHELYDVIHTQQVASLLDAYVPESIAINATHQAAQVLWQFLDGVCDNQGIRC